MSTEARGVVRLFMSVSLDGLVATPAGDATPLYPDLAQLRQRDPLREMIESTGAVVMGRRAYDMGDTDAGYVDYEHQVPIFLLTHRPPDVSAKHDPANGLSFTFVTDGVESAVAQAKAAAAGKDVQVIGVPLLLGDGLRLFEDSRGTPQPLEAVAVVEAPGRTDVRYRVLPCETTP